MSRSRLLPLLLLLLAGCEGPTEGMQPGECADGQDNDGDGAVDCDDPNCAGAPACVPREVDEGGCTVVPSGGGGLGPGTHWVPVPGYADPDAHSVRWHLLVYVPDDYVASEARPLSVFVTRNTPDQRDAFLGIMDEILGLPDFMERSGHIVAVPAPGEPDNAMEDSVGWNIGQQPDEDYFVDSLDLLEAQLNVNRARVHLMGSHASGGYATWFAHFHSERIASTNNQAGGNPFSPWPAAWIRPVAGQFIHDPRDEVIDQAAMEDSAAMFEAAGAEVDRFYDFEATDERYHDWNAAGITPRMLQFQGAHCVAEEWLD